MSRKKKGRPRKEEQIMYKDFIIYLEDVDFGGDIRKHESIINMWDRGLSIDKIGKAIKEDNLKTIIILLHLANENKLKRRIGGLFEGVE